MATKRNVAAEVVKLDGPVTGASKTPKSTRRPKLLGLRPLKPDTTVTARAYEAIKRAIMSMDIYGVKPEDLRLDERLLAHELGISRTPVREALARLEQEGLVRTIARRGVYVARKSKAQIIELITVWAALESMAARLAAIRASDEDLASLRATFHGLDGSQIAAKLGEYSELNLRFHQRIIDLSGNELLKKIAENLLIHMRAIRRRAIGENNRFARSIVDHMKIIEALERRDAELAEKLVREHALNLAEHVAAYINDLE